MGGTKAPVAGSRKPSAWAAAVEGLTESGKLTACELTAVPAKGNLRNMGPNQTRTKEPIRPSALRAASSPAAGGWGLSRSERTRQRKPRGWSAVEGLTESGKLTACELTAVPAKGNLRN